MSALENVIAKLESDLQEEIDWIEFYARRMKEKELLILELKNTINELKDNLNEN